MIDAKADVEEQWKQWQDDNPPSSFVDIGNPTIVSFN